MRALKDWQAAMVLSRRFSLERKGRGSRSDQLSSVGGGPGRSSSRLSSAGFIVEWVLFVEMRMMMEVTGDW